MVKKDYKLIHLKNKAKISKKKIKFKPVKLCILFEITFYILSSVLHKEKNISVYREYKNIWYIAKSLFKRIATSWNLEQRSILM